MDRGKERIIEQDLSVSNSLRDSFNIASNRGIVEYSPEIEAELTRVLQEAIWKTIEDETGMTKEQHEQRLIDELRKFAEAHGIGVKE